MAVLPSVNLLAAGAALLPEEAFPLRLAGGDSAIGNTDGRSPLFSIPLGGAPERPWILTPALEV